MSERHRLLTRQMARATPPDDDLGVAMLLGLVGQAYEERRIATVDAPTAPMPCWVRISPS